MLRLYNLALPALKGLARVGALFNPKVRAGLRGRQTLNADVRQHYAIVTAPLRVLVHSASYGELEQAKPVIAALRDSYPHAHIHVSFFSPSGFENAVGKLADVDYVSYLPEDSREEVASFLDTVLPNIVLFARYDVWPNLATELDRRQIPSIVFSATAALGSGRMAGPLTRRLHREVYRCVSKILTVTEADAEAFRNLGVDSDRISVAGDTRFDQVVRRKAQSLKDASELPRSILTRIQERDTLVFVVGSSWDGDERAFDDTLKLILERNDNVLTIIVPHEPTDKHVRMLLNRYGNQAILFSNLENYNREPIIVVDSIGKLFGLYSVADIAMVGGGFNAGVHNALEPAAWSVPVIFGPKHGRSIEARELIDNTAAFEVKNSREFDFVFWRLAKDAEFRESAGESAARYVEEHAGATARVMTACDQLLSNRS